MKKKYLNFSLVISTFEQNDVVTASLPDGVNVSASGIWGGLFG